MPAQAAKLSAQQVGFINLKTLSQLLYESSQAKLNQVKLGQVDHFCLMLMCTKPRAGGQNR